MTDLSDFLKKPFASEAVHAAYGGSFLHMRPAPEVANGEVVLASLYRAVGFKNVSERQVPVNGRKLEKSLSPQKPSETDRLVSSEHLSSSDFLHLISNLISSPKLHNQSGKRFLQINPLVPDAALYSLSARLAGNSWNPGALVETIVCTGNTSANSASELWKKIYSALSIDDSDDPWAQILQKEFETKRPKQLSPDWSEPEGFSDSEPRIRSLYGLNFMTPAHCFCRDLETILDLKEFVTRRQWTSMLESVLRLGTASHTLWVCDANRKCLRIIEDSIQNKRVYSADEIEEILSISQFWSLGQPTSSVIEEYSREFLLGRVGINLLFYLMEQHGLEIGSDALSNSVKISELTYDISNINNEVIFDTYSQMLAEITEENHRAFACKNGITKNILEFVQHVLRRRETGERGMESYDQGYFVKRRGSGKRGVWITGLGPVALISLVHSSLANASGDKNIADFVAHLMGYGFQTSVPELMQDATGKSLRNLGLILDSPDAEGGMVLNRPF